MLESPRMALIFLVSPPLPPSFLPSSLSEFPKPSPWSFPISGAGDEGGNGEGGDGGGDGEGEEKAGGVLVEGDAPGVVGWKESAGWEREREKRPSPSAVKYLKVSHYVTALLRCVASHNASELERGREKGLEGFHELGEEGGREGVVAAVNVDNTSAHECGGERGRDGVRACTQPWSHGGNCGNCGDCVCVVSPLCVRASCFQCNTLQQTETHCNTHFNAHCN